MGIQTYAPWNKGKLVGQKLPLKQREIWSIRVRLQLANRTRDLALFNLAIDSKLRGCDLVSLRVRDLGDCSRMLGRAVVMQKKTKRPVQFEIAEGTRQALMAWIGQKHLRSDDFVFPSRVRAGGHLGTRQYGRIVDRWVKQIGLDERLTGLTR
jgi:integrase